MSIHNPASCIDFLFHFPGKTHLSTPKVVKQSKAEDNNQMTTLQPGNIFSDRVVYESDKITQTASKYLLFEKVTNVHGIIDCIQHYYTLVFW